MRRIILVGVGAASLAFAVSVATNVRASTPQAASDAVTSSSVSSAGAPTSGPQKFLHEAAIGGMAEVELGKLAQENASNAAVKAFATQMVDDHGKANRDLETLAQQEKVTLPTQLDAKHTALRDRLANLSGAQFDRAYMTEMVRDHEKDVAEFEKAAQSSSDPEVKAFAAKTLPVLQGHLKMAKDVEKSL